MKKLTPKSCGHKTVPLNHFQSYRIILESVDTIVYPHTNLYPGVSHITTFANFEAHSPATPLAIILDPGTCFKAGSRKDFELFKRPGLLKWC